MESALYIFLHLLVAVILIRSFFLLYRNAELGFAVAVSEFLFIVGFCIYPVFYFSGYVDPGIEGQLYIRNNGVPGLSSAFHMLLYALGAAAGVRSGLMADVSSKQRFLDRWVFSVAPTPKFWFVFLGFSIAVYLSFLLAVGVDVALANAAAARSGEFDAFGEDKKYLFLKTFGAIGFFSAAALPSILMSKGGGRKIAFLFLYIVLCLLGFLNSISRGLLLNFLIAPIVVYLLTSSRRQVGLVNVAMVVSLAAFGGYVLLYGKSFGQFMAAEIDGDGGEFGVFNQGSNFLETMLRNAEFMWFSVDAGIKHFWEAGGEPLIPTEVILALIGFVPEGMLNVVGLDFLSYRNVTDSLPCVNARIYGLDDCTIPTYWSGYSAYLLPLGGGVIAGFVKFYVYGVICNLWKKYREINSFGLWVPFLLLILFSRFVSLIAPSISMAAYFVVFFVFIKLTSKLLLGSKSRRT